MGLNTHAPVAFKTALATKNEVNLVHQIWLRMCDLANPEEVHHHDVVHFALNELKEEFTKGSEQDVGRRFKDHLNGNKKQREKFPLT